MTDDHKKNYKTNCQKLYENHISGDRSEYVVTLDEVLVYEDDVQTGKPKFTILQEEKAYLNIGYQKKVKVMLKASWWSASSLVVIQCRYSEFHQVLR